MNPKVFKWVVNTYSHKYKNVDEGIKKQDETLVRTK